MPENPEHESYLWGNSAILCAFLLGQAFTKSGWHMKPGQFKEVNNLPFHTYKKDGETIAKPTAEVPLTDRAVDTMRSMGVIPVISPLNQDLVQVLQFLSISETAATLCGRWS